MIRKARVADIDQILRLGKELIAKSPFLPAADDLKARRHVAMAISSARMVAFVCEEDGQVVGFILGAVDDYWFSSAQYASDIAFYIREGSRHLARPMIKAFVEWARKFDRVVDVTLAVSSGLANAENTGKLYESEGFAKVGNMHTLLLNVQDDTETEDNE